MNEEKDDLILRVFGEDGELDIDKPDEGLAEYKQRKKEARDRMKLPQKWLNLFGGYENENEGVMYYKPNFKVSNDCCYYLKEKPCDDWAREHSSYPFLGMMASEGGQREEALTDHGCNYYGKTVMRSAPFAPYLRNDILRLAQEMDAWYHDHTDVFAKLYYEQPYSKDKDGNVIPYEPVDTIIPENLGQQEHREPDAVCVVLEYTWKNDHTGLTGSENGTQRNGSFTCTGVALIRRLVRSSVGEEC